MRAKRTFCLSYLRKKMKAKFSFRVCSQNPKRNATRVFPACATSSYSLTRARFALLSVFLFVIFAFILLVAVVVS